MKKLAKLFVGAVWLMALVTHDTIAGILAEFRLCLRTQDRG